MTRTLNLALVPILLLHLWLASNFELSHDEAYYWLYSKHMAWGFFDHPPMVGLIIKFFSWMPKTELAVRVGFIILQLASCIIINKLLIAGRKWIGLLLFFAFPLASFSGLFSLPDLPLLFFTVSYCYLLKRYLSKKDLTSIVGLSLVIPLLLYSKYHGILVVFFTLLALPKLFKQKEFYLIMVLAIFGFLPHLLWQHEHGYATLKYHFFERPKVDFSFMRLLEYSLTQMFLAGLFVGPIVWWSVFRQKTATDFDRALKFISLGTFLFFLVSTCSKKFEANWTIFLTPALIVLCVQSDIWMKKWAKRLLLISALTVFLPRFLLVMDPDLLKIKRLKEFHDWKKWAQEIQTKCKNPILANTYQMASKLSFYLGHPVHALNYGSRKNQFDFWNKDKSYYPSDIVCYLTDKKQFNGEIIPTPEGKELRLIDGFTASELSIKNP
jgi:hypothetical protein